MSYEPREGVDYLNDLYAVAGVEPDADADFIRKAINTRIGGYHPDRLEGLAPEFRKRGQQMARMLNKARGILLDPEKRTEYDAIRSEWDGPMSKDGTPAITIARHLQAEMETKPIAEIEQAFADQDKQIDAISAFSESRIEFLEHMLAVSSGPILDTFRQQYEEALLEQDRNLALKESQRADLLGGQNPSDRHYDVTLGYGESVTLQLEARKEEHIEETRARALSQTAQRLALLSGESIGSELADVDVSEVKAPEYFDPIAQQIIDVARQRESILEKRLSVFQPSYPELDLQSEPKPGVIVGIGTDTYSWFGFTVDDKEANFDAIDVPDDVRSDLNSGDFANVIGRGFNVITFPVIEHIELRTLLNAAIEKYYEKYYPEDEG